MDEALWRIENYPDFLEARRALLAEEANRQLASLLHGDERRLQASGQTAATPLISKPVAVGGVASLDEEAELLALNQWAQENGLSAGSIEYELVDPETGQQLAVLDLAWPEGVRQELTEPVAVLLDDGPGVLALANAAGLRCFTSVAAFREYAEAQIDSPRELVMG